MDRQKEASQGKHKPSARRMKWIGWSIAAATAPVAMALIALNMTPYAFGVAAIVIGGIAFVVIGIRTDRIQRRRDIPLDDRW